MPDTTWKHCKSTTGIHFYMKTSKYKKYKVLYIIHNTYHQISFFGSGQLPTFPSSALIVNDGFKKEIKWLASRLLL